MSTKLPVLSIIIDELLPYVKGCDLLALALTCKYLHKRVFQSKQWNALPFIKDIQHSWFYGMPMICVQGKMPFEEQILLNQYYNLGLPMEINLMKCNFHFQIKPNSQWITTVTAIEEKNNLTLTFFIRNGLLPLHLKHVSLLDDNVPLQILEQLIKVKCLELTGAGNHFGNLNLLPKLQQLRIEDSVLDFHALYPLGNVTELDICTEWLRNESGLTRWKQLRELSITADFHDISFLASLDNLEIFKFTSLKSYRMITKFPSNPPKKLKTLRIHKMKNENVNWLSGWLTLEDLYLCGPAVMNVDGLGSCVNLKRLEIARSKVTQLRHLARCKNLVELDLPCCHFNDWDALAKLPNLQSVTTFFDIIPPSFSQLKIDCLKMKSIRTRLNISPGLNLKQDFLKRLRHLELYEVYEDYIMPLQHATELRFLKAPCNEIKDIKPLMNLVHLEVLCLSGNEIKDISPLARMLKLKYLNLSKNQISNIGLLSNLVELKYLNLQKNQIGNIEPLSNLVGLEKLGLAANKIMNLQPLLKLKKLSSLSLVDNPISDLELRNRLMQWKSDDV